MRLLGRDDAGERSTVVLFGEVPSGRPGKPAIAGDFAGLRHAREAEVGGVGKNGRQNDARILRRQARSQVGEAIRQPRPAGHLGKQFGDPNPWHQR